MGEFKLYGREKIMFTSTKSMSCHILSLIGYMHTQTHTYTHTQQLCGVLMKYLTTEIQVQLYRRTVAALLHSLTPDLVTVEVKQVC